MKKHFPILVFLLMMYQSCSTINYLNQSEGILLNGIADQLMKYSFEEKLSTLGHKSEPWETTDYIGKGDFWIYIS